MNKQIGATQLMFGATGRGIQHAGLRRANERVVMTIIGQSPGVSNADIARLSGLAPQTVSAILADVEHTGMITRGEVLRGRRGQPATPISINPDGAFSIGCEVGWRHLDVVLIDMHARVRGHIRTAHAFPDAHTIVENIGSAVDTLRAGLSVCQRTKLNDLGLAIRSTIWRNLRIANAPEEPVGTWENLNIAHQLAARSGLEVSLFDDGNAACWGELMAFSQPRPTDFVYFSVSHFISAGIVGRGTLWEGPTGNSANLGSMLVTSESGVPEAAHLIASISGLERRLIAAGLPSPTGHPEQWDWNGFEPILSEWIEAAGQALAKVVYNTTTIIDCKLAVIDGMMPKEIAERLVDSIKRNMEKLPHSATQVVAGHLGSVAPALGAAQLTLYRRHILRETENVAAQARH